MIQSLTVLASGLLLVACSSTSIGPNAPTQEDLALENAAVQNQMCAFEPHPEGKQSACAHLIENRQLLSRFFAPEGVGRLEQSEKNRGRRITTRFIVNAAAKIKQCQKVPLENTLNIIRDVKIAGETYVVKGTSPLIEESSSCFLTKVQESS